MIEHTDPQGSKAWLESRLGVITGSRAKDARRNDGLTYQQRLYVEQIRSGKSEAEAKAAAGYKNKPNFEAIERAIAGTLVPQFSDSAHTYAKQLARERAGGREPEGFQGLSQRIGHEEEQFAAIEYVAMTGVEVEEAFFITTEDRLFGCSLDRWVGKSRQGALEIKTMVSSSTLFTAVVDGDISEYRDQCVFAIWLLCLEFVDLCLWAPDLQRLFVVRIHRDEDEVQRMEDDMVAFSKLVDTYSAALMKKLGQPMSTESPPWDEKPITSKAQVEERPSQLSKPVAEEVMKFLVSSTSAPTEGATYPAAAPPDQPAATKATQGIPLSLFDLA